MGKGRSLVDVLKENLDVRVSVRQERIFLAEVLARKVQRAKADNALFSRLFEDISLDFLIDREVVATLSEDLISITKIKTTQDTDQYGHSSGPERIADSDQIKKIELFVKEIVEIARENILDSSGLIKKELRDLLKLNDIDNINDPSIISTVFTGYAHTLLQKISEQLAFMMDANREMGDTKDSPDSPRHGAISSLAVKKMYPQLERIKEFIFRAPLLNPSSFIDNYVDGIQAELKAENIQLSAEEEKILNDMKKGPNYPTPKRAQSPTVIQNIIDTALKKCEQGEFKEGELANKLKIFYVLAMQKKEVIPRHSAKFFVAPVSPATSPIPRAKKNRPAT